MRQIERTTSERFYWQELLSKHGPKNSKFYTAAAKSAMYNISKIFYGKQDRQTSSKIKLLDERLDRAKAINNSN